MFRILRCFTVVSGLILFTALPLHAQSAPATAPAGVKPLTRHIWWSQASMVMHIIDRAPEFGVNALIIENNIEGVGWGEITGGLAMYDYSKCCRREGEERERVEKLRKMYSNMIAAAKAKGVDVYIMCPELHVPKGFGPMSFEDPALWDFIRDRLREVFQALPDLSGYVLYPTEGPQIDVEFLPGKETSKKRRALKLIETMWEACVAEKRKMMVTTFIHNPEMLEALAEALREFPPHPNFAVLQYCNPNDWGLYALLNPVIGKVGPHPEILGFDNTGENWGQGSHPFVQVDFMVQRLWESRARTKNLAGLAGYAGWWDHTALGTLNEVNIFASRALVQSPMRSADSILQEWCGKRFGPKAAVVAANCLRRTHTVVFKSQHVRGYWLDTITKSCLPTLKELDEYFIDDVFGEALGKWDPKLMPIWEKIQHPDKDFLIDILAEKEEAIRTSRQSFDEITSAKDLFKPDDAALLQRVFRFQEMWAGAWQNHVHAFFLRRIGQQQGWTPELRARLDRVLKYHLIVADEFEKNYGINAFPRGPDRIRQFVADIQLELKDIK